MCVCLSNSNSIQHPIGPRHRVSLMVPPALPSSRAATLEREQGEVGERGEGAGQGRHLLRRQCTAGCCLQRCALITEAEERCQNLSMCLPLSYPKYFWLMHLLENKRQYHLWKWEITDRVAMENTLLLEIDFSDYASSISYL